MFLKLNTACAAGGMGVGGQWKSEEVKGGQVGKEPTTTGVGSPGERGKQGQSSKQCREQQDKELKSLGQVHMRVLLSWHQSRERQCTERFFRGEMGCARHPKNNPLAERNKPQSVALGIQRKCLPRLVCHAFPLPYQLAFLWFIFPFLHPIYFWTFSSIK